MRCSGHTAYVYMFDCSSLHLKLTLICLITKWWLLLSLSSLHPCITLVQTLNGQDVRNVLAAFPACVWI